MINLQLPISRMYFDAICVSSGRCPSPVTRNTRARSCQLPERAAAKAKAVLKTGLHTCDGAGGISSAVLEAVHPAAGAQLHVAVVREQALAEGPLRHEPRRRHPLQVAVGVRPRPRREAARHLQRNLGSAPCSSLPALSPCRNLQGDHPSCIRCEWLITTCTQSLHETHRRQLLASAHIRPLLVVPCHKGFRRWMPCHLGMGEPSTSIRTEVTHAVESSNGVIL